MNTTTLASAVVRIGVDQSQFRAGLAGVHSQLTGFVGASQLLAGRIAGGLIGGAGQAILARKAQGMLGSPQANVVREQANVAAARKGLSQANVDLRIAQDQLRFAMTAATKASALANVYAARTSVQVAQANIVRTTGNLQAAKTAASAAQNAFAGTAAGIGAMATAAAAAVGVAIALAQGLVSAASAGAALNAVGHNVNQVFGSWGQAIKDSAELQATMFGRSKTEFMDYATTVGQQLEVLGVKQEAAANVSTKLAEAISTLANARRISFGEAAQMAHGLVTDNEIRGYAIELGLLTNRNQILDEGTAALLRYELEAQKITEMTAGNAADMNTWRAQVDALKGSFDNLVSTIGADLEPVFVNLFKMIGDQIGIVTDLWNGFRASLEVVGLIGPRAAPDLGGVDQRNAASIETARRRREAGQAIGAGGGRGGFQGGLVEFAKRVQEASFNQNTAAMAEKQLTAAEKTAIACGKLVEILLPGGKKMYVPNPTPWKGPF